MSWSFAVLVVVVVLGFMFPSTAGGVGGKSPVDGERRLDCPSNILGASNSSGTKFSYQRLSKLDATI